MIATLEFGECDPEIHGNKYPYCQKLLREIYNSTKGSDTLFTLTPVHEYQIEQGWPEPPFVNINTYGSRSTRKENWLGYIPIDFSDIDYEQIIDDNGRVNAHGHIEKSSGEYGIYLNVSDKYKMLDIYAQMDKRQVHAATYIAHKISAYYLMVDAVPTDDGKHYDFLFRGHPIANASAKKIKAWLGDDGEIVKSRLRINKFRQDYADIRPYTQVTLTKRIIL